MTLADVIPTQKEIQTHWKQVLMGELAMPFSPKSHQYCLYLLDQCNSKERKTLLNRIFKRFYDVLSKSKLKKTKNIPQEA